MTELPDYETCYLLGLLVGGGELNDGNMVITLPLKDWGEDPETARRISKEIINGLRPKFKQNYGFEIDFVLNEKGDWIIVPDPVMPLEGLAKIQTGLSSLGLPTNEQLILTASLTRARKLLKGKRAEHFLSGIFDARASIAASHRRFTDSAPTVSIEVPGKKGNFQFVVELCSWLTELGSITDQVLYNHPNFHARMDPYYENWKKGFKIRLLADSFLQRHSFAMQVIADGLLQLGENQQAQTQLPCRERIMKKPRAVAIHPGIFSEDVPEAIRGKIFLHYFHLCASLGCPNAPIEEVQKWVAEAPQLISFFPLLRKGSMDEVRKEYDAIISRYFPSFTVQIAKYSVKELVESEEFSVYPKIDQALAFLCADELSGKRTIGPSKSIIEQALAEAIFMHAINKTGSPPIYLFNLATERGAIVSCLTGEANASVIADHVTVDGIDIRVAP
jgi:hypothetical protein